MRASEALDVAAVRARFPALARPLAYLDGPGGSQVPEDVIEAIGACLRDANSNLDGAFATSTAATAIVARAREAAARFTGSAPEEIAFGPNMTTLNFLLAHAVARTLAPGEEIVVTDLDHDANVSPWLIVAADHDLVVRHAPIRTEDGTLDEDALEGLLGPRTRVVAFTLASNALGSIPDAARIAAAAHAAGALAWADGVHLAPHRPLRRAELGLDVLLCSPYKFFGPHAGVAAIRRELAETLPADRVRPASEDPPGHRFETGTQSHEALAGTTAAIAYMAGVGYDAIEAHETALAGRFLDGLARVPRVELYGIRGVEGRTPTFCLNVGGLDPRHVTTELAAAGIQAWDGDYYAPGPMRALGLHDRGAVRIGLLHYNTDAEVDRVLSALEAVARAA
ncbi:MAG: cysteine desulfurase family protein [Solirubrobacterales bacterium]|nr:cysteine desulfurase family protein [Solirubrobacterales bacterium]